MTQHHWGWAGCGSSQSAHFVMEITLMYHKVWYMWYIWQSVVQCTTKVWYKKLKQSSN